MCIYASQKFVMKLYATAKVVADNLDALRLKLTTKEGSNLAKLPPCERSFTQHVEGVQWQV